MHAALQMKTVPANGLRHFVVRFLCLPALGLGFLSPSAVTQSQPTSPTAKAKPLAAAKLIEVRVTGSQRFTEAEVSAASGLPVGTMAGDEDFRKAARQLGESGAFADVAFTYSYSSAGIKLTFQVSDAEKFVPARFADFVWFTDQELLQKVHERVPLFKGELPASGRLPDQVSDILQALLVENHIAGHVEYFRTAAESGPLEAVDYSVSNVTIRIRRVEFTGVGASELPLLEAPAEKLSGREYARGLLTSFAEKAVLPVYRERGYLKAACAPPEPKVVKDGSSEPADGRRAVTMVDVTLAISPGIQYKLTGWTWLGNKEIATDALQPLLHAKVGQPANIVQLEDDLRAVQQLYGSRGLVTASVKAGAEYDDIAGTTAYQLVVTEGVVYHMGELAFRGIDNNLEARLRAAWKIRPGDVYDATYLKRYLPEARKLLPGNLDWEVSTHVTALARDKTVDVDFQYTAKAAQ